MMLITLLTGSLFSGHSVHGFTTLCPLSRSLASPPFHSSFSFNDNGDMSILNQAVDCSLSDGCSVEQAEWYLSQVMNLQQECTIDGEAADSVICENPEKVSQVIRQLQNKIIQASMNVNRVASEQRNSMTGVSSASVSPILMTAGVALTVALTANVLTSNYFGGENTVAFTAEEWWWALRDNYLPLMVIHFIRDGGLLVSEM